MPPRGIRVTNQIQMDKEHPQLELPDLATDHSENFQEALPIIWRNPKGSHDKSTAGSLVHQSTLPKANSTEKWGQVSSRGESLRCFHNDIWTQGNIINGPDREVPAQIDPGE